MNMQNLNGDKPKYLNPYFGGVLLGLLVLLTVFITGRGLGASGAVKSAVVTTADVITPTLAKANSYTGKFISGDQSPMYNWLVFESLGIFLGGLLSGILFRRVKKPRIEHNPKISGKTRLIAALLGGALFGIGSQFGRGCTSGAALSGSATFSFGGVVVMLAIFGSAYAFAWFFRKLWI
jgi:uncharacterized membrane protein YedE/YeeE